MFTPEEREPLMLDRPVDELPLVSDRGWNSLASENWWLATLSWWVVLLLVGLAAWPLTQLVFGHWADGGYGLARGVGLLLVSYLVWIGSSLHLVGHRALTAWVALALLGGCSFFGWRRRRDGVGGAGRMPDLTSG
jgi:hypothetical protein